MFVDPLYVVSVELDAATETLGFLGRDPVTISGPVVSGAWGPYFFSDIVLTDTKERKVFVEVTAEEIETLQEFEMDVEREDRNVLLRAAYKRRNSRLFMWIGREVKDMGVYNI